MNYRDQLIDEAVRGELETLHVATLIGRGNWQEMTHSLCDGKVPECFATAVRRRFRESLADCFRVTP